MTKRFTYNMNKNKPYESPAIRRIVPIRMEGEILAGSVVDHADITSVGQKVTDYNFSDNNTEGFNHTWED